MDGRTAYAFVIPSHGRFEAVVFDTFQAEEIISAIEEYLFSELDYHGVPLPERTRILFGLSEPNRKQHLVSTLFDGDAEAFLSGYQVSILLEYGDTDSQFEALSLSDTPIFEKFTDILVLQWDDTTSMERHGAFTSELTQTNSVMMWEAAPYAKGVRQLHAARGVNAESYIIWDPVYKDGIFLIGPRNNLSQYVTLEIIEEQFVWEWERNRNWSHHQVSDTVIIRVSDDFVESTAHSWLFIPKDMVRYASRRGYMTGGEIVHVNGQYQIADSPHHTTVIFGGEIEEYYMIRVRLRTGQHIGKSLLQRREYARRF